LRSFDRLNAVLLSLLSDPNYWNYTTPLKPPYFCL